MKIFYINLDASRDRDQRMRSSMTAHRLEKVCFRWPGTIADQPLNKLPLSVTGCLLSHLGVLQSLSADESAVILEDDALLSPNFGQEIEKLTLLLEKSVYDLLFLGQTVLFKDAGMHAILNKAYKNYLTKGARQYLEALSMYRYGAFGYIVNKKSVEKIKSIIAEMVLEKEAEPIDKLFGNWLRSKRLRGVISMPYLVGVDPEMATTMHDRDNSLEHQLHCELVNTYVDGYASNVIEKWEETFANQPDEIALAICHAMYRRIARQ